jgi:hypothetical protein
MKEAERQSEQEEIYLLFQAAPEKVSKGSKSLFYQLKSDDECE